MYTPNLNLLYICTQEAPKKKQLAETVHLATLQLLEQKMGQKEPPPKPPSPIPVRVLGKFPAILIFFPLTFFCAVY